MRRRTVDQTTTANSRRRQIPRRAKAHNGVESLVVPGGDEPTVGGGVTDRPLATGVAVAPWTNSGEMTSWRLAGAAVATTVRLPATQARVTVVVATPDALVVV